MSLKSKMAMPRTWGNYVYVSQRLESHLSNVKVLCRREKIQVILDDGFWRLII